MVYPGDYDYDYFINIDNENYIETYDNKTNTPIYNKPNEIIRVPTKEYIKEEITKDYTHQYNDDECQFSYDHDDINYADDTIYSPSIAITIMVSFITTCITKFMDT